MVVSLPSQFECHPHLRKNPDANAHFVKEAATRQSANMKVALNSPLLNSCPQEAAAGRVPYNASTRRRYPSSLQSTKRTPNVKHGHDKVPTFEQRQGKRLRKELLFVTISTTELLCDPPSAQLWSVDGTLVDCDSFGAYDTTPFLRSSGSRNVVERRQRLPSFLIFECLLDSRIKGVSVKQQSCGHHR